MRFCNKCQCWKPDRTHHCSTCRKCILRMDHHCPWFATCIGFRNQKFFLLFLSYVSMFCITCAISSSYAIYDFIHEITKTSSVFLPLNWVALCVISSVFGAAVAIFAIYSVYLAAKNTTVLESLESVRYKTTLPSSAYRYREAPSSKTIGNIFDLGWKNNLRQIMGEYAWQWFIPFPLSPPSATYTLGDSKKYTNINNNNSVTMSPSTTTTTGSLGDGTWFPINEEIYKRAQNLADSEDQMLQQQRRYKEYQRNLIRQQELEDEQIAKAQLQARLQTQAQAQARVQAQIQNQNQTQIFDNNNNNNNSNIISNNNNNRIPLQFKPQFNTSLSSQYLKYPIQQQQQNTRIPINSNNSNNILNNNIHNHNNNLENSSLISSSTNISQIQDSNLSATTTTKNNNNNIYFNNGLSSSSSGILDNINDIDEDEEDDEYYNNNKKKNIESVPLIKLPKS